MFACSNRRSIVARVPDVGVPFLVLDPIIDLKAGVLAPFVRFLIDPAKILNGVMGIRVVAVRLVDAGDSDGHAGYLMGGG